MKKIIQRLLVVPDCVPREHFRFIQISNYIYFIAFLTHIVQIFVFYFLKAPEMMLLNIFFSLPIFVIAIYINHKVRCYFNIAFSLAIFEFVVHQILAIHFFGWSAGFQYYLFLVSAVVFFNSYWKNWLKITIFSFNLLIFLGLYYYSNAHGYIYDLQGYSKVVMIVNSSLSFIVYAVIISYYIRTAWKAEQRLDAAINDIRYQKKVLSEQNKDIMSSIQYAKIIQNAILPEHEQIKMIFNDIFIFYRPKDIVSGDFYWINHLGQYRFAIVADCTGHGVPGAFMSMISNTLFNNIIIEKGISDPSDILYNLHQGIRSSLRQDSDRKNADDGLDVCILRIDIKEKKAVFAGAKRPLYICYDGEISKIKGDVYSIGGKQRKGYPEFNNHEIEYKENTTFYLSSDGFSDQAGFDGKKYGSKRFKDFLAELYYLSPDEAEETVSNEFMTFRADKPQRDDIAIVGIRL